MHYSSFTSYFLFLTALKIIAAEISGAFEDKLLIIRLLWDWLSTQDP